MLLGLLITSSSLSSTSLALACRGTCYTAMIITFVISTRRNEGTSLDFSIKNWGVQGAVFAFNVCGCSPAVVSM